MHTASGTSVSPFHLTFKDNGILKYRTDIVVTITENGKERKHQTKKNIEVRYINYKDDLHQLSIHLTNTRFMYSGMLRKSEGLMKQLSELYKNLSVYINPQGSIHSILHLEELQQRWREIRPLVERRYKGGEVLTYLDVIENRIQDEEKVLEELKPYRFLGLIFPGLCSWEGQQSIQRENETFFLEGKKMRITETLSAEVADPKTHTIKWLLKGEKHKEDQGPLKLNVYKGYFIVNTLNGWLQEAELRINIKDEKLEKETLYTVKRSPE